MARDSDTKEISSFAEWLDSDGTVPTLDGMLDDLDNAVDKVNLLSSLWKEIKKSAQEAGQEEYSASEVIAELAKEKQAKERKAARERIEYEKKILEIETAIAEAKNEGDKETLKKLKDRLKAVKEIHDIEEDTQELKNKAEAPEIGGKVKAKQAERDQTKQNQELGVSALKQGLVNKDTLKLALTGGVDGGMGVLKAADTIAQGIANLAAKLDKTIEELVKYKSDWDTRLFGSNVSHSGLIKEIASTIGASPFVKQADVMKNIDKAIESGIAYNVSQRAFLETVKDDIARTFDAFDSTLMQIVRVQQSDSTAARLGMEATLNQFLNSMYQNTEYLNSLSDSVTSALYEATSLLTSEESIGFEYQVQKWLGSLYSVGMSQQSVTSIAQALGQLASGNTQVADTGAGRLLIMSASKSSNLNLSEMLRDGLDDSEMNELMYNMVQYLADIANSNRVVQSRYANIFGLNTSDIVAAKNLQEYGTADIASSGLSYGGSIAALNKMARSIGSRQSAGELLENAFGNLQFTTASGIAENPALYAIWKISNMLEDLVGGIPIPFISAMGFGVDLETTVADLMKVGAMSAGIFSGLGSLVSAVNVSGGLGNGVAGILSALGVNSNATRVSRGTGLTGSLGETVSTTTFIGQSSGTDIENASKEAANDQKNQLAVQEEEENDTTQLSDVDDKVAKIYDLFQSVIVGGKLNIRFGDDLSFSAPSGKYTSF